MPVNWIRLVSIIWYLNVETYFYLSNSVFLVFTRENSWIFLSEEIQDCGCGSVPHSNSSWCNCPDLVRLHPYSRAALHHRMQPNATICRYCVELICSTTIDWNKCNSPLTISNIVSVSLYQLACGVYRPIKANTFTTLYIYMYTGLILATWAIRGCDFATSPIYFFTIFMQTLLPVSYTGKVLLFQCCI